jgi:hypothetical protein
MKAWLDVPARVLLCRDDRLFPAPSSAGGARRVSASLRTTSTEGTPAQPSERAGASRPTPPRKEGIRKPLARFVASHLVRRRNRGARKRIHDFSPCPREGSNLRTRFRKPLLYPLSYEGKRKLCIQG